jgi:hypothetical protein
MKAGFGIAVLALAASACATAPKTPEQMILGKWTCDASSPEMKVKGVFDYKADGTASSLADVEVDTEGMKIGIKGNMGSTWKFLPDGKLQETITSMSISSATMNGQPMDQSMVAMMQPMVQEMVVNQSTTSQVTLNEREFNYVDDAGVATACTR